MSNRNKNNNNSFKDLLEKYENHQAEIAAEEQGMKEDSSTIDALQQQFVTMRQQMDAMEQNINTMKKRHESKRKQLEEKKERGRLLKERLQVAAYPNTKTSAAKIKDKEIIVLEDTDDEEHDKKPAAAIPTPGTISEPKSEENKTAISSSSDDVIDLIDDSVDITKVKEENEPKNVKGEKQNPVDQEGNRKNRPPAPAVAHSAPTSRKITKRKFSQVHSDTENSYPSDDDDDDDSSDEDYIDDDTYDNHSHSRNNRRKNLKSITTPAAPRRCKTAMNMKPTPEATPITPEPSVPSSASSSHDLNFRALERSEGRTRKQLNNTKNISKFMGDSKFGQKVVCAKNGKVYAIILNDEWNKLATYENDKQDWYVGEGQKRRDDAEMVGRVAQPIPIFHLPKKMEKTNKLYYVGHFKVESVEVFQELVQIKDSAIKSGKQRQMRISFKFDMFHRYVGDIIAGI
jgi:hypothetical protein